MPIRWPSGLKFSSHLRSLALIAVAAIGLVLMPIVPTAADAGPIRSAAPMTGLWLWNSDEVLADASQQQQLVTLAQASHITDIFLYLQAADYTDGISRLRIRAFNRLMSRSGLHVWGLEGWRGYFDDADGPALYYAAIDNLVAFNKAVLPAERFVGFHSDMEPQDGQGPFPRSFHNGLPDSRLSTTGGGNWYPTQAEDREMLMRDWLTIHQTAQAKLAAAGLKMAAAMPSWTEDYYGEPVMVTYDNVTATVGTQMMNYVSDYIVMSYNTDPANAAGRVQVQAGIASRMPLAKRPRVSAAMETHPGAGVNVSYADTPGKDSRAVVLSDMATITSLLDGYAAFGGVSLHDWVGWQTMPP